jgi:hypothetical protein
VAAERRQSGDDLTLRLSEKLGQKLDQFLERGVLRFLAAYPCSRLGNRFFFHEI